MSVRRMLMSVVVVLVLAGVGAGSAWAAPALPFITPVTDVMNDGRSLTATTVLADGRVLIVGGMSQAAFGGPSDTATLFDPGSDPANGTFSGLGDSGDTRVSGFAAQLSDGRVLLGGGFGGAGLATFDSTAGTFAPFTLGGLAAARPNGAATAPLPGGKLLIAGGAPDGQSSAEVFDPATNTFTLLDEVPTEQRWDGRAAALPDGRVLIAGGSYAAALDTAEIYDPVAHTFSGLPAKLSVPRHAPAVTALPDGKVLVAGGSDGGGCGGTQLTSADVFDPRDEAFHPLGVDLDNPRCGAAAVTLQNGTVLIVGGFTGSAWTATAEILTPAPSAVVKGGTFEAADVGKSSPEQAIEVRNLGAQDLVIGTGFTATGDHAGDFAVGANTCSGVTLAFKEACTLKVTFTPGAAGARTARIELPTNEPTPGAVKLSGTGVAPGITKAPGSTTPLAPSATTPATTGTGTTIGAAKRFTCTAKRARGRTRITCTVKLAKPRAASVTLRRGAAVLARGRITKAGRVTLTTALKPRPGTYTLRIGKTKLAVRLR